MGMRKVYGIDEIDEAFLNHLRLKLKEYATLFTFCM
jgi:hypothetical protein